MLNNPKRILRTVLRYVCLLDYLYSYIQTYLISLLMVCSGIVFQNIFAYVTLILTPSTHCRLVRGVNSVLHCLSSGKVSPTLRQVGSYTILGIWHIIYWQHKWEDIILLLLYGIKVRIIIIKLIK